MTSTAANVEGGRDAWRRTRGICARADVAHNIVPSRADTNANRLTRAEMQGVHVHDGHGDGVGGGERA